MVTSQEMFMLFFSILYGIMLNSLIGRGAFPITSALAGRDLVGFKDEREPCKQACEPIWARGCKSARRFGLAIVLNNIVPICYFAIVFLSLESIVGETVSTLQQVLSIGLLSLTVFSFMYLFFGLTMLKHRGSYLFYNDCEFRRFMVERRTVFEGWREHIFAGGFYLIAPWIVVAIFVAYGLLPIT